jgi:ProP effector
MTEGDSKAAAAAHFSINRYAAVRAMFELLVEMFPQCFAVYERRRRPLKVGIHLDILTVTDGAPEELSNALRCYVSNDGYLRACQEGAPRIDLKGQPAGEVSATEAANATAVLAARRLRHTAQKAIEPLPKRLSLTGLKAAALARKQVNATQHEEV